ncbi:hypothetical protein DRN97_04875 [Methanosarcinales archaeon]|nr:MAG: hypothetical protein DRN97_04875 [Methanosarcinales archaeon]
MVVKILQIRVPGIEHKYIKIIPAPQSLRMYFVGSMILATAFILFWDGLMIYVFIVYGSLGLTGLLCTLFLNFLVFLMYYILVWTPYYYLKNDGKYAIKKFRESYKKGKLWKFICGTRMERDGTEYNVLVFKKGFSHYPIEVWIPRKRHEFLSINIVARILPGYHPAKEGFLRKFDPLKKLEKVSRRKGDKWVIQFKDAEFELTEEEYEDLEFLLLLYKRVLKNLVEKGEPYDDEPAF